MRESCSGRFGIEQKHKRAVADVRSAPESPLNRVVLLLQTRGCVKRRSVTAMSNIASLRAIEFKSFKIKAEVPPDCCATPIGDRVFHMASVDFGPSAPAPTSRLRRFQPFAGRAEPTGLAAGRFADAPLIVRSTTYGGPCRSRYDPPRKVGPDEVSNERDARQHVSRSRAAHSRSAASACRA